ncbi:hypothetical protein BDW22DRAFT_1432654 [Trametopsis cervina]|nr:hypothetical protein BDW22DRAFT_1432654 [Trametopsis cervina]
MPPFSEVMSEVVSKVNLSSGSTLPASSHSLQDEGIGRGDNATLETIDDFRNAASELKRFHQTKDPRRFTLIQDVRHGFGHALVAERISAYRPTGSLAAPYKDSGMPDVVLDIVMDDSIYAIDGQASENYVHSLLAFLLACTDAYARVGVVAASRDATIGAFVARLQGLFEMLWSRKPAILSQPSGEGDALGYSLVRLGGRTMKLTGGRLHHFMMYLWIMTTDFWVAHQVWRLIMEGIYDDGSIMDDGSGSEPDLRTFLEEAIIRENYQERFVEQFSGILAEPTVIDEQLMTYLDAFREMCIACPKILNPLPPALHGRLREGCSGACQRQFCSGSLPEDVGYNIFKCSFYLLS